MSDQQEESNTVDLFRQDMLRKLPKLRAKCFKEHWRTAPRERLLFLLRTQLIKLECAVAESAGKPTQEIIDEAADVANFAMMIADNARRELSKERNS